VCSRTIGGEWLHVPGAQVLGRDLQSRDEALAAASCLWLRRQGLVPHRARNLYAAHGVSLLINNCQGGVVGIDDFTAGKPALTEAIAQCSDTTPWLFVQHSPGFFDSPLAKSSPARFDLIVSGHTHGGQLAIFGWAPVTPEGSGRFVSGDYVTPLGRLFVTRGLGTSLLPIRLGARPELVFITVF